jgi:hypothetical protein
MVILGPTEDNRIPNKEKVVAMQTRLSMQAGHGVLPFCRWFGSMGIA